MTDTKKRPRSDKTENADELVRSLPEDKRRIAEALRDIIRNIDPKLEEIVKWNAPSYTLNGEDRLTFNLHGAAGVRLVFHCGAARKETRGALPLFTDETGLLDWVSDIRAIAVFASIDAVNARGDDLRSVVMRWLDETKQLT